MATSLPAPPLSSELIDRDAQGRWTGLITRSWVSWFTSLTGRLTQAAGVLKVVSLTGQSAAIGTTAIALGSIAAGLYRVSWRLRVTQAATVSSSVTVTIGWVESGVTLTSSGAAVTGNTTTTTQSGSVLVSADAGSVISYATSYASSGATAMQYALSIAVEAVG